MIDDILRDPRNLTTDQYAAVVDNASEILCLACAGSGKSRTLAFRIARLIAEGDAPESIVAFTFTEKAADSIKRRVADALEKCGLPPAIVGAMFIGTIHSYCQTLLGEVDARYTQFEVLDENRLLLYLLSRYPQLGIHRVRLSKQATIQNLGQFKAIREVANAFKIANDELINFDDVIAQDEVLGQCLHSIYNSLLTDQYIDFSLMIRLAVEALRENSPGVSRALRGVKHLMVDEYQDVNPSQEALIQEMYSRMESLFVVGDDDQAIYGWRGADVRNIVEFDQRYPNCSPHSLSTNFRSTAAIVESSNAFVQVELSARRIDKQPVSHSDGNIRHFAKHWFGTREQEAQWVANRINQLLGTKYIDGDGVVRGLTKSDFAILMRSVMGNKTYGGNPHHREYTNALEEAGIPFTIEAEEGIFEKPHPRCLREAMELLRAPAVPRSQVVRFHNLNVEPLFPNSDLNAFTNVISNWSNEIHRPRTVSRRKVYPQKLVHDLLHAFGLHRSNLSEDIMRDIGVFSGIFLDVEKVFTSIDSAERFQNVLNFLANIGDSGYDSSQVELISRPNAVTVSTVHKMKGLEYPVVFVVDVVNSRFPKSKSDYRGWLPNAVMRNAIARGLYQTDRFGEARLFYTALTRAERFLYVTGAELQPGLQRGKKPSEFSVRLAHAELINDPTQMPMNREVAPERQRIDDNSMPTSFTEIKDYLDCPMKYKYRKIYGFSSDVPEMFGFGLTTHTAINKLHQNFPDSAPAPVDAEDAVESVFHLKHVFPSNDVNRPGPFERAKEKTKELVTNYAVDYTEDFTRNRQVERKFEIKAGRAVITGAIDLLLKEDAQGNILNAEVIDFKSMDFPEDNDTHYWINLALQVQLYAHASQQVLGENTYHGAVHLLKAANTIRSNRIDAPVTDAAIEAAIQNIVWAVDRILVNDFPWRPSTTKCENCDFNLICPKTHQNFSTTAMPPAIHIPPVNGIDQIHVRAFSDIG